MTKLRDLIGKPHICIGMGTVRVPIPENAVDWAGGVQTIIFFDAEHDPISAYEVKQKGPSAWAEECTVEHARARQALSICPQRPEPLLAR